MRRLGRLWAMALLMGSIPVLVPGAAYAVTVPASETTVHSYAGLPDGWTFYDQQYCSTEPPSTALTHVNAPGAEAATAPLGEGYLSYSAHAHTDSYLVMPTLDVATTTALSFARAGTNAGSDTVFLELLLDIGGTIDWHADLSFTNPMAGQSTWATIDVTSLTWTAGDQTRSWAEMVAAAASDGELDTLTFHNRSCSDTAANGVGLDDVRVTAAGATTAYDFEGWRDARACTISPGGAVVPGQGRTLTAASNTFASTPTAPQQLSWWTRAAGGDAWTRVALGTTTSYSLAPGGPTDVRAVFEQDGQFRECEAETRVDIVPLGTIQPTGLTVSRDYATGVPAGWSVANLGEGGGGGDLDHSTLARVDAAPHTLAPGVVSTGELLLTDGTDSTDFVTTAPFSTTGLADASVRLSVHGYITASGYGQELGIALTVAGEVYLSVMDVAWETYHDIALSSLTFTHGGMPYSLAQLSAMATGPVTLSVGFPHVADIGGRSVSVDSVRWTYADHTTLLDLETPRTARTCSAAAGPTGLMATASAAGTVSWWRRSEAGWTLVATGAAYAGEPGDYRARIEQDEQYGECTTAVVTLAAAPGGDQPPGTSAPAPTVSLAARAKKAAVKAGHRAVVTGTLSPAAAGESVALYRVMGTRLRRLAVATTRADGGFTLRAKVTKPGRWRLVVVSGGTRSAVIKVRVRR